MNTYICFFGGQRTEVQANTSWEAHVKAKEFFKPRKSVEHMISVCLAEKNGETVEINTGAI